MHSSRRSSLSLLAAVLCPVVALTLAGCGSEGSGKDPKTLVVATHDSWAMPKDVLADFEIVDKNVKAITALGLELKDINSGLIDFLAERDGRDIYLCWRYNEPRVAHWHDLEAGFAGRKPLE